MKKGDLSLSTNAIVVLIMALVILGLMIGFTQGMFGDLRSKLSGYDKEPDAPHASAANPLTTSKMGDFTVNRGEEVVMKISVYNSYELDWQYTGVSLNCGGSELIINDFSTKEVMAGTTEAMILVFDSPSSDGIKICKFKVGNGASSNHNLIDNNYNVIEFVMTVG